MRKLPNEKKKINGTYRPDRDGDATKCRFGLPRPDMSKPPQIANANMSNEAKGFWFTMEPTLTAAPYYSDVDKIGIAMACNVAASIDGMFMLINEDMADLANASVRKHTSMRGMIKALCLLMDEYRLLSKRFGLDPMSRDELTTPEQGSEMDELDKLLRGN